LLRLLYFGSTHLWCTGGTKVLMDHFFDLPVVARAYKFFPSSGCNDDLSFTYAQSEVITLSVQ
jgi:hypothetical protein